MLSSILIAVVIMAVGARVADTVRLRQEEAILHKLSVEDAHGYYQVLKRRARRVRLLRAVTLASLALALFAARRRLFPPPPDRAPAADHAQAPSGSPLPPGP